MNAEWNKKLTDKQNNLLLRCGKNPKDFNQQSVKKFAQDRLDAYAAHNKKNK